MYFVLHCVISKRAMPYETCMDRIWHRICSRIWWYMRIYEHMRWYMRRHMRSIGPHMHRICAAYGRICGPYAAHMRPICGTICAYTAICGPICGTICGQSPYLKVVYPCLYRHPLFFDHNPYPVDIFHCHFSGRSGVLAAIGVQGAAEGQ